MQLIVKIIGILIVIEGVLFVLKPTLMQKVIVFFLAGRRLYVPAVLRIVLAVILLVAASQCQITLVIIVLGILLLVSGIAAFSIGLDRQKAMLNWWQQKSSTFLRLVAVIALLLGAVVIYSA